jgi:sugar-specific transcriptional regulator TrmB
MSEKVLTDLGLSSNEAKVYLTLLKLGSTSAGEIAKKSKVYRTNAYEALNRLIEKGLVSYIFKGHQKFYEAEHPEKITDHLNSKLDKFQEVLPQLLADLQTTKTKDKAHLYEGILGVKAITDDLLKTKQEIVAFGLPKNISEIMKNFVGQYHKKRIELKITQKHVYDEDAKERIKYLNSLKYTQAKYLPGTVNSPATTIVYGDKVAFWIWSDPILSVLIESKRMSETYRHYFEILWKIAI